MLAINAACHVAYGQSEVLHGSTSTSRPARSSRVVGRNGMGKSTLMKSLIGHHADQALRLRSWWTGADIGGA